jgi:hypothetical protein
MCGGVVAHLFSDIRNMGWQTLYSNMSPIAPPRKNTPDHASHTHHKPHFGKTGHLEGACHILSFFVFGFNRQKWARK